jgi:predicted nucleic acid-binding protein
MPALDALILAGLVKAGCRTIYTRDEHFTRYAREGVTIVLLD